VWLKKGIFWNLKPNTSLILKKGIKVTRKDVRNVQVVVSREMDS